MVTKEMGVLDCIISEDKSLFTYKFRHLICGSVNIAILFGSLTIDISEFIVGKQTCLRTIKIQHRTKRVV